MNATERESLARSVEALEDRATTFVFLLVLGLVAGLAVFGVIYVYANAAAAEAVEVEDAD